jgi:hypothetical protein
MSTGIPPAVVLNGHGVVFMDSDADAITMAGQGFIYGVVDNLIDEMVQSFLSGITDVHGWSFANGFKAIEDLNLLGSVGRFV